ncbi:phosphatidate cytidylyltransferase [Entomophthora muscae]|uniref:Phosphatidate cytidylyltransferase n=1 Tax=Entomophthora muscae TaxID=34485 RepID=A0ACC2UI08_9FUNG|nr:phosphatidate cytidylyltransferase [Entomophthora muscae]
MTRIKPRAKQLAASLRKSNSERVEYESDEAVRPECESKTQLLVDQDSKKRWANWHTRAISTIVLVSVFGGVLASGPLFIILLVMALQAVIYYEVVNLVSLPNRQRRLPWLRSINWYFFFVTNYFLYGDSIILNFKDTIFANAFLLNIASHHYFKSFSAYCLGFIWFVLNLRKNHYRFQFSMFAVTHMALLLVVFTSHFIVKNIFKGMFWFLLPISLVIVNDIGAYIAGFFFGRTPLIELSPKKTVEGFVGGLLITVTFGVLFSLWLCRYNFMICAIRDLTITAFSKIDCIPNPVFAKTEFALPPPTASLLALILGGSWRVIRVRPILLHSVAMSIFASLIAPFGGFFASGLKRAFNIKDFADVIPGHGGLTDRFDCQFMMGLFSYIYYTSFIETQQLDVGTVLETIVNNLSTEDQMALYRQLGTYLQEYHLIPIEKIV